MREIKKSFKRSFALLLAVVMVVGLFGSVGVAEGAGAQGELTAQSNTWQSFLETVPPFQREGSTTIVDSVNMGGNTYGHAIRVQVHNFSLTGSTSHNLNGEFYQLSGYIGHVQGTSARNAVISFYGDGTYIDSWNIIGGELPINITVNVTAVRLLRISFRLLNPNATFPNFAFADAMIYGRSVVEQPPPQQQYFTITPTATPANGGTVHGGGTFVQDSITTIHATPNSGWVFDGWYENNQRVSTNPVWSITVDSDRVLQARFSQTPQINITTISLPNGRVGDSYHSQLSATGATPITWNVTQGSLPHGLTLNQNTGVISGTPSGVGTFNFTVRAQSGTAYTTRQFSITINPAQIAQWPPSLDNSSDWARDELRRAANLDLFPPSLQHAHVDLRLPITREEFAGVVVRTFEQLSGTTTHPAPANRFNDTQDMYVRRAYTAGLMVGTGANAFSPNTMLNREQAATALARTFRRWAIPGSTFATDAHQPLNFTWPNVLFDDDANISYWARESVYFMAANGIILGTGNNRFSPQAVTAAQQAVGYAQATREQAILIALRMVEHWG